MSSEVSRHQCPLVDKELIITKKWIFNLNIDSWKKRRGGSCIDSQITLETDKECKHYLIKTQQRTKSRCCHKKKKVKRVEIKDLLIVICF